MTKQIDIKELIPFIKDGWVAMDKCGEWYWHATKPERFRICWDSEYSVCLNDIFDIAPADDWTKSLIKVEGGD